MQNPIKERIVKLRDEIAQISEANRLYLKGGKKVLGATYHERRLQRLQDYPRRVGVADRLEETLNRHRR
jgi:hypothetical protein